MLEIDADEMAIVNAKNKVKKNKNIKIVHENFKKLYKIYQDNFKKAGPKNLNGIVFDLGLSSAQLQDRSRGFSFQLDAPLNMSFAHTRMDTDFKRINTDNETEHIVNKWSEKEISNQFEYQKSTNL